MLETHVVGTSPPRPDGDPKVRGRARYGDDFVVPGMLYGATVRSAHARAEILGIAGPDLEDGRYLLTEADLPGPNGVQLLDDSWPILARDRVEHVGQAVALVAAPSRAEARELAERVEVSYRELPAATTLAEADPGDLLSELSLDSGDVDAALAAAPRRVEGSYGCGHQEHIYIEPNVVTAWMEDESLYVAGSMQCPYYVEKSLKHALGLPAERVRVRATAVGGGFGGKEDYPSMVALHAALLARAAGRPVRIAYDRHEDIVATTKRHPARIRHRSGVAADGTLLALDVDVELDGGAFLTLSPVVLSRAVLHATGAYRCANVRVRGRVVRTNTAPNGAFRGFGAPQVQFAMERHMDRIARAVEVDPLTLRRRNALRPGDRLPTGQVLDDTTAALDCLERVAETTDFRRRWQANEAARDGSSAGEDDPLRSGLGLSLSFHGAGFTGNGERRMRSPVIARLGSDGRIQVLTSMTEMGQGCAAIFPQIAQEATGLGSAEFEFVEPDTGVVPDSGPTVASRATMVVGGTIAKAAAELVGKVLAWHGERAGGGEARIEDGRVRVGEDGDASFQEIARRCFADRGDLETTVRYEPPEWQQFDEESYRGDAYPTYSWAAAVVEVEVDEDTFEVRPERATVVAEVGKAIHPVLCRGQIEGGTLQALGYGLLEEMKLESGRYLNDRLTTYIIPTFKDSPRIDVELLELGYPDGPFGAKGVGELPMDGGAPAAVAAIQNAVGVSVDEIPATPERIQSAWTAARGGG